MSSETTEQVKTSPQDDKPFVVTENMIRLRRRFDFTNRPRPKALAIIHPETREVLHPGIDKMDEEPKPIESDLAQGLAQSYAERAKKFKETTKPKVQPLRQNTVYQHPAQQIGKSFKHKQRFTLKNFSIIPEPQYHSSFDQSFNTLNSQYNPPYQDYANYHLTYYDLPYAKQHEPWEMK